MAAKVSGRPAPAVIAALASRQRPAPGTVVLDIECGRGASTVSLARALPDCPLTAGTAAPPP
ncbi:hypothetical protein ABZ924_26540 [Streptomyces sp. NPDC046876]|uniref:hypothetical protein n=1 Tax=Streptomyces sp. NPDC046876 TaxID=3155616 RepID=UPI0033F490EE